MIWCILIQTHLIRGLHAQGVKHIYDALDFGVELTRDFSNGNYALDAPEDLLDFAGRLLETAHLPNGVSAPLSEPREGTCNGANALSELREQSSHNFSISFDDHSEREKQSKKISKLPDPAVVFDRLLRRKGSMVKETGANLNFVWVSWINFYFEDTLRTKPKSDGAQQLDPDSQRNNLAMVYGRNYHRESLLRSFTDGKLKTSRNSHGEEIALAWEDLANVSNSSTGNRTEWQQYVLGDDALNTHWGHIFWVSVYTREHNRVCDELLLGAVEEGLDIDTLNDERLFRMARVVMTTRHARAFLESFASDVVLRSNGINTRFPFSTRSCDAQSREDRLHRAPVFSIEYLHAYTFHHSVPDYVEYKIASSAANASDSLYLSLADEMFRKPSAFANYTLQEHADAFYRSPAGHMAHDNIPGFLGFVFRQQLMDSRANRLANYKSYVEYYSGGTRSLNSFADLGLPPELTQAISELYETVEDVDLYVGVQLEGALLGKDAQSLTRTALILGNVIPGFLSASCYDDASVYSTEFLTRKGVMLINAPTEPLWDLVRHHVQFEDDTPFSRTLEWGRSRMDKQAPKTSHDYSASNLGDYAGLNSLWEYSMKSIDEYLVIFVAITACMAMYTLLHTLASWGLYRYYYLPNRICDGSMALLSHYFVMGCVLTVQIPVYTYVFLGAIFSDRLDLVLPSLWAVAVVLVSSHAVLYTADIAVRKPSEVKVFVVLHHLCWLAGYVIPIVAKDLFTLRVSLVADYFIVYEGGLYLLMFYSKLQNRTLTGKQARLGRSAIYVFATTRIVQVVIMACMYVMGLSRMVQYGYTGLYVFSITIMTMVTMTQVYVLYLYSQWPSLWRRNTNRHGRSKPARERVATAETTGKDAGVSIDGCISVDGVSPLRLGVVDRTV